MPAKPIRLPEGIDDHRPLQKKIWAAQRVAWALFALMLIACLFGAFGRGGYLSRAITQSAAGAIDFPLLTRWNAPENLEVTLEPSSNDRVFFVDGRFFESFSVEGIDPPQKATTIRNGLTGYVFASDAEHPVRIVFRLQTQSPGLRRMSLGIDGDVSEHISFVFP